MGPAATQQKSKTFSPSSGRMLYPLVVRICHHPTPRRPPAVGRDHWAASLVLAYRLRCYARPAWVGDGAGAAASRWPVRTAPTWSAWSPTQDVAPAGNTAAPGVGDCAEYRVGWPLGITGYAELRHPRTAPVWHDSS